MHLFGVSEESLRDKRSTAVAEFLESNKRKPTTKDVSEAETCAICLGEFEEDSSDMLVVQLTCSEKHVFHYNCLKEWAKTDGPSDSHVCPTCRKPILPDN